MANAALQPLWGRIYDKFSNKSSFLASLAIFEMGSVFCGAAVSSKMLIGGRAVAGVGSAGLISGGLTITASAVPLEKRAPLTAILMGVAQLGIAIGPLLGGAFTAYTTWRWCFYVNIPIGGLLAIGLLFLPIPDQCSKPSPRSLLRRLHRELDLLGFALIGPACIQLLLALSWGGSKHAWDSPTIIGLFCGASVTGLLWIAWDWYRGDEALIPFSIIGVRAVWSGALTHCFLLTNIFCASFFLPIYFQAVQGADPMKSGANVLPSILSQLAVVSMTGFLGEHPSGFLIDQSVILTAMVVQQTGYVIPYAMLAAVIGSVSNGLYSTFSPTTSAAKWIGYQILNGIGRGVGMPMVSKHHCSPFSRVVADAYCRGQAILAVQATLSPADLAIGNSVVIFVQSLGTAITLAVSDAIFQGSLQSELPKQAPSADVAAIVAAGATHFRSIVEEEDLPGVLAAYSKSLGRVFYLAAGVSGLGLVTSLGMGWVDVSKKGRLDDNDDIPLQNLDA